MKKIACFFTAFILWGSILCGQSDNDTYYGLIFHSGYVIKNHPAFPEVNRPSYLAGIRAGYKLNGNKLWHKYYHYADIGLNFIYGSAGNKKNLGNIAGLIPEITFSKKLSERWSWSQSLGLGASYFNKPYNTVSNPDNIVIGSHITFCASAAVSFDYRIKEKLSLTFRPCIYHSSNSHSSLPNVGMNLPLMGIGVKYRPHNDVRITRSDSASIYDRKIHFSARLGLGVNEQGGATGPANGPKYPIYLASVFITKKISPVNKLQAGFEGWYNTGVYDYITSQDFFYDRQKINSAAFVFFSGHEFLMGHFSLVTQGGVYLYNPFYAEKLKRDNNTSLKDKLKTIFHARLGCQYYLFDAVEQQRHNLFVGIYIKTNLGQADFLDSGIGYTF